MENPENGHRNENEEQNKEKKSLDWKDILALIVAIFWQFSPLFLSMIIMAIIVYILLILMR